MIGSLSNLTSAQTYGYAGGAEAKMNTKLVKYYVLPFTLAVPVLQTIATDLTIYDLLVKRIFTGEKLEKSPWPDRYKEVMDLLDNIASGETPLVAEDGSIIAARTDTVEVWSSTKDYLPTFHEDRDVNQIQDEDKIDGIRGDRGIG